MILFEQTIKNFQNFNHWNTILNWLKKHMNKINYQCFEDIPEPDILNQLTKINQTIFSFGETEKHLLELLSSRKKVFLCLAFDGRDVVGFKLGFRERGLYFESWRGGVLPSHRKQGIAQELMRIQHEWCRKKGFQIISTITDNDNTGMLIANLRAGFSIVGTFLDRQKIMKVVLQKQLHIEDVKKPQAKKHSSQKFRPFDPN